VKFNINSIINIIKDPLTISVHLQNFNINNVKAIHFLANNAYIESIKNYNKIIQSQILMLPCMNVWQIWFFNEYVNSGIY